VTEKNYTALTSRRFGSAGSNNRNPNTMTNVVIEESHLSQKIFNVSFGEDWRPCGKSRQRRGISKGRSSTCESQAE
jgi:hypothetical protein